MKKLLTIITFCFAVFAMAATSANGHSNSRFEIYTDSVYDIRITGDTLVYTNAPRCFLLALDTVAICTFEQMDGFLRVNTIWDIRDIFREAFHDMTIKQIPNKDDSLSCVVRFKLPNIKELTFIGADYGNQYKYCIGNDSEVIFDAKDPSSLRGKYLRFAVGLADDISDMWGLYNGIVCLYPFREEIHLEPGTITEITMPGVRYDLFARFYIDNEFMLKTDDYIEWRGRKYWRVDNPEEWVKTDRYCL